MYAKEMLFCSVSKYMTSNTPLLLYDLFSGWVFLFYLFGWSRFSKMERCGSALGMRTVAGRIVMDSYGAAKQQHTFTVRSILDMRI